MVLANRRAKYHQGLENNTKTASPSDHFPVNIKKITLTSNTKGKSKAGPSWKIPLPPCEENTLGFNRGLRRQYRSETAHRPTNTSVLHPDRDELNAKVEAFQNSILAASELHLDRRPRDEKDTSRSLEVEALFAQSHCQNRSWYDLTKNIYK